eukprot:GFYU01000687.1.p1 GENE.GFYU01000687.1~~GFYU01000687.1.p1  ORF type:complete len:380 (-),score=79.96 GFYU01000687.1:406-1545(-)
MLSWLKSPNHTPGHSPRVFGPQQSAPEHVLVAAQSDGRMRRAMSDPSDGQLAGDVEHQYKEMIERATKEKQKLRQDILALKNKKQLSREENTLLLNLQKELQNFNVLHPPVQIESIGAHKMSRTEKLLAHLQRNRPRSASHETEKDRQLQRIRADVYELSHKTNLNADDQKRLTGLKAQLKAAKSDSDADSSDGKSKRGKETNFALLEKYAKGKGKIDRRAQIRAELYQLANKSNFTKADEQKRQSLALELKELSAQRAAQAQDTLPPRHASTVDSLKMKMFKAHTGPGSEVNKPVSSSSIDALALKNRIKYLKAQPKLNDLEKVELTTLTARLKHLTNVERGDEPKSPRALWQSVLPRYTLWKEEMHQSDEHGGGDSK